MKKLFLSSNTSPMIEIGFDHFFDDVSQINLAYITTAQKEIEGGEKGIKAHRDSLKEKGIKFEEIDIAGKTEQELKEFFKDKNAIYVDGGNASYLLKSIRESGFDVVAKEMIEKGIPYFGVSAGAYVLCPTIIAATWRPTTIKVNRFGVTDFSAMNLVPFLIFAHYDDSMENIVREKMSETKHPIRILRDGQAIMIEDDETNFVGEGEEVKL